MNERSAQLVLGKQASRIYRAIEDIDDEWVHIDTLGDKLKEANNNPTSIFAMESSIDGPSEWTDDVIAATLCDLENRDIVSVKEDDDGEYHFQINEENNLWIPYPLKSKQEGTP